ncbi:MAG: hypothetical protein A2Z99_16860 [Treponema sp. GWB1_62_6]|nr:MAG: hypothetical protein A2Z99_16860 [Treponema sp. GWB1_62_6]OHE63542.1 MAG: hypothetical protein A2Y36_00750 [Treponema sp. GWA1_62_8]OHE69722.1 MAG: hypothetical protein A2001_14390 [Treponema sp. GWC1_61_84]HCM26781.1 hypothetical protein [Treponema sp.]
MTTKFRADGATLILKSGNAIIASDGVFRLIRNGGRSVKARFFVTDSNLQGSAHPRPLRPDRQY